MKLCALQTDRSCHFKIKMNAPAGVPGTAVFMPPEEAPTSTITFRAYVYSAPAKPYGYVNAPGFYQVCTVMNLQSLELSMHLMFTFHLRWQHSCLHLCRDSSWRVLRQLSAHGNCACQL